MVVLCGLAAGNMMCSLDHFTQLLRHVKIALSYFRHMFVIELVGTITPFMVLRGHLLFGFHFLPTKN